MLQSNSVTEERRADERLLVRCPIKFRTEQDEGLREASAKDFSDRGIGFFTHSRIAPNTQLELWVNLLPEARHLHVTGRVVWTKRGLPRLWRAGVRLEERAFTKIMRMLLNRKER
ncbi:PilZ domain-containing protein [Candidatus Omnitrophota bacterium]